jgi:prophage tail gpP-like protein
VLELEKKACADSAPKNFRVIVENKQIGVHNAVERLMCMFDWMKDEMNGER